MDSIMKLFPAGYSYRVLVSGSRVITYREGTLFINPDGFCTGQEIVVRRLCDLFRRKKVGFVKLSRNSFIFNQSD